MDKLRVALIGCGGRNSAHYQKLTSFDDVELVGFCDLHIERAQKMSDGCGQGRVYEKYEEMLDAEKPDAVYIAVEPCAHGAIEQAVLARNIPFMIEKPMTLDFAEAEKVRDQIKEKGLICSVGFQDRYQNLTLIMKDYIKDKKVGLVSGGWMGGIPGVWWWRKMETSGGQIVEQNIHLFDQLRFLFGEPATVYCAAGKGIVDDSYNVPGYNVDDYSSAVITFKNGVIANLFTSDYHVGGSATDSGMTVYCKDATLHYSLRSQLTIHDKDGWHDPIHRGDEQTGIMDRIYVDAIKSGDPSKLLTDYADAVESLRLTMACNESIATGKVIQLN